jgi:hypothetical protein
MAGLEPARANYSPTDFKSVASTIPPHRLFALEGKVSWRAKDCYSGRRKDSRTENESRIHGCSCTNPCGPDQIVRRVTQKTTTDAPDKRSGV